MTHDHSFQLFSLCHSKIQTQTNCKEVWPCSTQCIFHCLGGDDAIIYRIDCRCVEKVRVPPCWAAYLSLDESLKNGLSNLQGCDKVVLGTRIGTINKNRKDSSRFAWNKGLYSSGACDSSGLFIARRHENQPQTDRCHGRAFDATCLGRNFFAIWVVSLKLIEVRWHWFWHKASRSMWTFLSVYSSFCYNLCPQLAKNLN